MQQGKQISLLQKDVVTLKSSSGNEAKTGTLLREQNEVMGQQIDTERRVSIRHLIYFIQ